MEAVALTLHAISFKLPSKRRAVSACSKNVRNKFFLKK